MDFNTSVAPPSPVALDLRPPASQSPFEIAAQLQEGRARAQQMQAQTQAMQTHALQQQEMQMNLEQRKAINSAYQSSFTPQEDGSVQLDEGKLTKALATSGHGEAIPGIMENWTKYKQSMANLQETNSKVAAAEQDAAGNLAATVKAANNDPTLFHTLLTDAINRKAIQPGHYAPLDQQLSAAMQQDPTGEAARKLVSGWTDQMIAGSPKQQELANAKTTADARAGATQTGKEKEAREAGQQQFQNAISDLAATPPQTPAEYQQRVGQMPPTVARRILNAVPAAQYDPAKSVQTIRQLGMTPEQQTQAEQTAANAVETGRHNKVEEQQGAGRLAVERQNAARMQKQFDATYGALLGPNGEHLTPDAQKAMAEQDPMARAIANYQLPPPAAGRSGPGAATLRKVMAINPDYDAKDWQNRSQAVKEFANTSAGKAGGQALALNTLIHHADLYLETADALKNDSFRPGNAVYNKVAAMFGSAPPTNAALVARFFASETGKVATGGVPAEGEINGILKSLGTDASPEGIAGAAKSLLQIAAGRATPLMERAKQAHIDKLVQVIGPDAKGILARHGFDPETMKPVTPGGQSTTTNTKSAAAPAGKIAVISPEGTAGYIDADKWDAAQKRGFKRQ